MYLPSSTQPLKGGKPLAPMSVILLLEFPLPTDCNQAQEIRTTLFSIPECLTEAGSEYMHTGTNYRACNFDNHNTSECTLFT